MAARTKSTTTTKDGITWYYEQEGTGPHVVLITDGLGECQMFDKPMSLIAAAGFTVTTFDGPGMSRSSSAPPETYEDITPQKLARAVITLMDQLGIDYASFWGCSSGGCTVLALVADYPERVRNGIPHEVPTITHDNLGPLASQDPDAIATIMAGFSKKMCADDAKWDALGPEVHARLHKNYPRWAYGYPRTLPGATPTSDEVLHKRPLDWTVGAATPMEMFFDNVVTATKAGIGIKMLPGSHFPYVSAPEAFAQHVVDVCKKYV